MVEIIAKILSQLDGVKDRGHGQWFAKCPAHDDRSPSLSIKESDNGTLLLHCFGGCSAHEIVSAVGMELKDLFPANNIHHSPSKQIRWNPRDLLALLNREMTIIVIAASDLSKGIPLSEQDKARLNQAYTRLSKILEVTRAID